MTNIKRHDSRVSELIHFFYRISVNPRQKLEFLSKKPKCGILWDSDMQEDYVKFLKVADFQKENH